MPGHVPLVEEAVVIVQRAQRQVQGCLAADGIDVIVLRRDDVRDNQPRIEDVQGLFIQIVRPQCLASKGAILVVVVFEVMKLVHSRLGVCNS